MSYYLQRYFFPYLTESNKTWNYQENMQTNGNSNSVDQGGFNRLLIDKTKSQDQLPLTNLEQINNTKNIFSEESSSKDSSRSSMQGRNSSGSSSFQNKLKSQKLKKDPESSGNKRQIDKDSCFSPRKKKEHNTWKPQESQNFRHKLNSKIK